MNPIQVTRKPKKCHNCNNRTVGDPTEEAFQLSEEGKRVLGGCIILENSPDWAYAQCKTTYSKI